MLLEIIQQLDNPFLVKYIGLPYLSPWNPDGTLNTFGSIESGALNADGLSMLVVPKFVTTPFIALNTAAEQIEDNETRGF